MSGAAPVIVAYLGGQLLVAHEAIVALWKVWKTDPGNLEGAILEAVKCVPEDLRTPDMPQLEEEKTPTFAERGFTQKGKNPMRGKRERNRNIDDLV